MTASRFPKGLRPSNRAHFGARHPLALVAANHCADTHMVPTASLLGGTACPKCWEHVIRADERFVVEFELPTDPTPDRSYVDEIAVERACRGERIRLTGAERREAVNRLAAKGVTETAIADRLHLSDASVRALREGRSAYGHRNNPPGEPHPATTVAAAAGTTLTCLAA